MIVDDATGTTSAALVDGLTRREFTTVVIADKGTVEPGRMANLVVLDADPEKDLSAFARPLVTVTVRGGRIPFQREARAASNAAP